MADTIESFVKKLQTEGVEAGEQAARKLKEDAQREADDILAGARQQAEKIIADAKRQGDDALARARTDMELAARDTVLKLRESLTRLLRAVLTRGTQQRLGDADFLKEVIRQIVLTYAAQDKEGKTDILIDVAPELREQVAAWAMAELGQGMVGGANVLIDAKGDLSESGFEYTISGATVEVTRESVAETLADMVNPELAKTIDAAMAKDGQ